MKEKAVPVKVTAVATAAAGHKKKIQISVKKLREVTPPHPECSRRINDESSDVQSAFWANKCVSHVPTVATSGSVTKGMFKIPAVLGFQRFSNCYPFISSIPSMNLRVIWTYLC